MQRKKSLTSSTMLEIREFMDKGNSLGQSLKLCGLPATAIDEIEDWQKEYLGLNEPKSKTKTQTKTANTTEKNRDLSRAPSGQQLDALREMVRNGDVSFEKALRALNLPEDFILRLDSWGLKFIADKRAQVLTKEIMVWGKKMDFRDLLEKREQEEKEQEQTGLWK